MLLQEAFHTRPFGGLGLINYAPIVATTQMVHSNMRSFRMWIDHLKYKTGGVPPIVFVDEAHTASNLSAWGGTIKEVSDAGAYIVLCTATPYRTDGRQIPGFDVTTTHDEEHITKLERVGAHVYRVRGRRVVHMLTAHHTTTFQEAWQESVICGITREPFAVNLRQHGIDGYSDQWLSELNPTDARKALSRVVRSPLAIRTGAQKLVKNLLRIRQKDAPQTAGIVFVGNDDGRDMEETSDADTQVNEYANLVKTAIEEECATYPQGRKLNAVIATTAVSDAAKLIEDFQQGTGDILIVKMMASVGLDIARLKVALDLSSVRTDGSFVQRVMRTATRWEPDGRAPVMNALYITPDDCLGEDLYQRLIHDQGGGGSVVEWEDVEEIEATGGGRQSTLTEYEVIGTGLGNVLQDADGSVGPGILLPVVDSLLEDLPYTTREIGKGKLSSRLFEAVKEAGGVMTDAPSSAPTASPGPSTATDDGELLDNSQQRMELKRKQIVQLVKNLASGVVRKDIGPSGDSIVYKERLGPAINDTWINLYNTAGVRWLRDVKSGQLLKSLDEPTLDKLTRILKGES